MVWEAEVDNYNNSNVFKNLVQRVRKTALSIARRVSPTPDFLVVELGTYHPVWFSRPLQNIYIILAALLHDILDKKYVSPELAANPYEFFKPYFTLWASSSGVNLNVDGRGQTIARIVDNVSWSTEKRLREEAKWTDWHRTCVELHCVQDADRLDAIGAFGTVPDFFYICFLLKRFFFQV